MRLSELKTGDKAVIVKILGHGAFRKRVMDMGFVRGREVKVLLHAPLKDPIKYSIMDYEVSLRASEASLIEVVRLRDNAESTSGDAPKLLNPNKSADIEADSDSIDDSVDDIEQAMRTADQRFKVINVALVGNPNCGKTSLFNEAAGANEHVGNYSGVTVDAKSKKMRYGGYTFNMVDLPGTYSLTTYSPEERYVRQYLREQTPDVIINVVDASNLERNLYLTTELIDMGRSMVIALNMFDELNRRHIHLDYKTLGAMIGVPIIPTISKSGEGISTLLDTVISVYEGNNIEVRHIHVNLGSEIERAVTVLKDRIKADGEIGHKFSPRYIAIKLLEGDSDTEDIVRKSIHGDRLIELRNQLVVGLKDKFSDDVPAEIAAEKYGYIAGALAETRTREDESEDDTTRRLDTLFTSKIFGYPLFLLIMFFIFWLTFSLGQFPMDWISAGVDALSSFVHNTMPDGPIKDLVANGIIGGVGGVIVFLPNILILYLCISFLEDTGYMARAVFIMDKVMHRIGLHGKSFIPLIMGFGCNVPAILSSRAIESRSSRIITILINPFMSCSARLPIYILIIGTFFPRHGALVFFGLYVLGIAVAVTTARLLRRFMFKKDETPFVMELPPYRMPSWQNALRHTWEKGQQYLRKMGGIILFASIIVWALNYYPHHDNADNADNVTMAQASVETSSIDTKHDSFLQMAGKAVNPIMEPLGFTWPATVAAIAGIPAKEIVVSTLGVLYTNNDAVDDTTLGERLQAIDPHTGQPGFTWQSALSFLIFILLYCPCMATVVAIGRETGSWKYSAFSMVYNTAIAWFIAFIIYQLLMLFA